MDLPDPNREALLTVARHLGPLREEFVFLGGAVVGLLVTDVAAPPVRPTKDVDVIVEVSTRSEYDYRVRELMLRQGFRELRGPGIPACAWHKRGVRLDVMPTDASLLGFSNRWYPAAVASASGYVLDDVMIRLISAPCFLATKLEAYEGRGKGDVAASPDLEDVVAVVDGRPALAQEIEAADSDVRAYLSRTAGLLLGNQRFLDALPGHLMGSGREGVVLERLRAISAL